MAQNDRALFLYGIDITSFNKYINFKVASMGLELTAVLTVGNYTLTELLFELKKQMELVAGGPLFTWTVDRTVSSGLSNKIHVSTTSSYLSILFGTGTSAGNSPASLLGFLGADYTGATTYAGNTNAGTILVPEFATLNFIPADAMIKQDGSKNVSSAGIKETLVFAKMSFTQGQWKWITNFNGRTQYDEWVSFLQYATKQLKFEYTPSLYEDPNSFYKVTVETTSEDSNGMAYKLNPMLSDGFYRFYDSGLIKFRLIPD